jgi:hypothetical protein
MAVIDDFELDMERMYMGREDKLSKEFEENTHKAKFE